MSIRKVPFVTGEHYHIYNRGVEKRNIFSDEHDVRRFFQSMEEFNVVEPIGSIYENNLANKRNGGLASTVDKSDKLVNFIAYCLNPNHYHFILEQISDDGIKKFMHRLGTGYTRYFNDQNDRNGALFQGKFKSVHINSNEYLLHLSAYVNLNNNVHKIKNGGLASTDAKLVESKSSWHEYIDENGVEFCNKEIILEQFKTKQEYKKFAEEALQNILERRYELENLENFLIE